MKKLLKIFLILILYKGILFAGEWQIVSTMPVPVKGAQAVAYDTTIYVLGGFSDSLLTGTKIIQSYYPNSNTWKILDDSLVVPRYGLSAHVYNGAAYIYGGATTSTDSSYALVRWDFSSQPQIYRSDFNFNRKFSTSVIDGDYLYIFGGYPDFQLFDSLFYCVQFHIPSGAVIDTFAINDLYNYDLPSVQMSTIANKQIYVFGGVFNGISKEINTFGLEDKQWKFGPVSLSQKRAGGVALKIPEDNQIALIGGFNETNPALNSLEIYNYESGFIEEGFGLNNERAECTAIVFGDAVFVFGGKNTNGEIIATVEKIDLPFGGATTIGEGHSIALVSSFENVQNYPNPFNPETTISFRVNTASHLTINIFNMLGKKVKTISNQFLKPANYKYKWDGKDEFGKIVSSGIYFLKITSDTQSKIKRMVLIR
jgi:Secretion system C-terminal sorting domain/Kelch motif